MSCTTEAFAISQTEATLYLAAFPIRNLLEHARVDYWGPENKEGYQRPLDRKRLKAVSKYVREGEALLPTSVLLSLRPEEEVHFERRPTSMLVGTLGELQIPIGAELWVIDGQHRLFGLQWAIENEGAYHLEQYPVPVTILECSDRYVEMLHFHIINTSQRRLQTDIADRHLDLMRRVLGPELLRGRPSKDYLRARAVYVVDKLNETEGPWQDKIKVPGVPGREFGLVRQHALVASLDPVFEDPSATVYDDEQIASLVVNYWRALEVTWSEAFSSPAEYRTQATAGIYSLHMLFPSIIRLCAADSSFGVEKMAELLMQTGLKSQFWHREYGSPLTVGTGMGSIRLLAHELKQRLPPLQMS
jgi:DGQHR domain-containing protein